MLCSCGSNEREKLKTEAERIFLPRINIEGAVPVTTVHSF